MQRRTASIVTAASLVGVGVSVWTLATTEPIEATRRGQSPREFAMSATHEAAERPYLIASWTSGSSGVGAALWRMARESDLEDPVQWWMEEAAPPKLRDEAGEAMATYGWGVARSRRTARGYQAPEVQRLMRKTIELLEARAESRPQDMRYWQWNTLGFAHFRVGQFDAAAAALGSTREAISDLQLSADAAEYWAAVLRLEGAWDLVIEQSERDASAFGNPKGALWRTVLQELEEHSDAAPRVNNGPAWLPVALRLHEAGEARAARRAMANLRRQLIDQAKEGHVDSAWPQAAEIWMRMGDAEQAHDALREVASIVASSEAVEPIHSRSWWRVFYLLRDFYDRQAALDALRAYREHVAQRLPDVPGRWRDLGERYASLGAVSDAIACYTGAERAIEAQDPEDRRRAVEEHLHSVAWSYRHLGREDLARAAWRRWTQTQKRLADGASGTRSAVAWYNVACGRALLGEVSSALDALETSIDRGYRDANHALVDPDLAPLRSEPRFTDLIDQMRGPDPGDQEMQAEALKPGVPPLSRR